MINDWVNLKEDECQLVGSISRISSCVIWNGYNYFFIWSGLVNLGCYLRTMMGITMMSKYSTSKLQISQMNWNWKSKQSELTLDSIRNWMQFLFGQNVTTLWRSSFWFNIKTVKYQSMSEFRVIACGLWLFGCIGTKLVMKWLAQKWTWIYVYFFNKIF